MSAEKGKGLVVVLNDPSRSMDLLCAVLRDQQFETHCMSAAAQHKEVLGAHPESFEFPWEDADALILPSTLPEADMNQWLDWVHQQYPQLPIVSCGSLQGGRGVAPTEKGSFFDQLSWPIDPDQVRTTMTRAVHHHHIHRENNELRQHVARSYSYHRLIGKSKAMREVFSLIGRVAQAEANVLIMGESGTGKELVARAVHEEGPRAGKPFVAINCTSIPEALLESELFGHAKGAFTGAIAHKKGLFAEAEGGTIFLDEIGDLDMTLQAKLLRVIQERKIRAVGENLYRDIDVRIIAATHKDLKKAIKEDCFREDLYYRLSVIPIVLPPLRHRRDDIPLLAGYFLKKYSTINHSPLKGFTPEAMRHLMALPWEGNVRELENVIERLTVLASHEYVKVEDLTGTSADTVEDVVGGAISDWPTLEKLEQRYIQLVLSKTGDRKEKAAQILGINRKTLYRKEQELSENQSPVMGH
ncbi:MAG: sigma-54-dependent Fis family transcriptional regulator [Pseudobdellovibrionaceae bacterium]|nr:sigma-54-dependent Fis family transcriptional regulator [Bdellovibrionales bacterium]USN47945.1 MAG: sigma-54-dependent Fis family transcriptional regulator [Pseudobdellovibrionaceae bacterium]